MGVRDLFLIGVVLAGTATVGAGLFRPTGPDATRPGQPAARLPVVDAVDAAIRRGWAGAGARPGPPAPDLVVMRRLALALTGSIPSLEEIRRFEARPAAGRGSGSRRTRWSTRR